MKNVLWFFSIYFLVLIASLKTGDKLSRPVVQAPPLATPPSQLINTPPVDSGPYTITNQIPNGFMPYSEIITWMQRWNKEAPEITEFGTYGQNRQGTDLHYLRIGTPGKPKLLIHACIHGNERLATACTVGFMGKILHDYKRDEKVTWIVKNRDVYFVPVFSPESYLRSRHIEEGDPNRRWAYPGSSTNNGSSPIQAMQKWFLEMKFVGAVDGHTYGRDFFWPSIAKGNDAKLLGDLSKEMAGLANYNPSRISNSPSGYAIDWYYWKGAASVLTEFGNGASGGHSMPSSMILTEFARTYPAYLHFMKRAPEVQAQLQGPSSVKVFTVTPNYRRCFRRVFPRYGG